MPQHTPRKTTSTRGFHQFIFNSRFWYQANIIMPKSKRDKKVSLTKTIKHGKAWKKDIYTKVRNAAEKYSSIYVIRVDGMRIGGLNEIRKHFKDSVILLGKNKVMALALGKDSASEVRENVHKVSERLSGETGLLFTDRKEDDILQFFDVYCQKDYARSGMKAKQEVLLQEGPLKQFSHAIEPHLRSLGMPTQLKKGVVTLLQDFTVCKKGAKLTPQQANILKLLEIQMAEFRVKVDSKWTAPDDFKVLLKDEPDEATEDINQEEPEPENVEMEMEMTDDESDD